jgi:hypothetical protein
MEDVALATSPEDVAYVVASYLPFDTLARGAAGETDWPGVRLPRATYRTQDGTLWFARDWWRLHDEAGGIESMHGVFTERARAAAALHDHPVDLDEEWEAYVAGLYGACLHDVTPELIVLKAAVVERMDRALTDPRAHDPQWCDQVRSDVALLDGIVRPLAACDRIRFGRPTSRDRLITDVRRRFPHVFGA